MERNCNRCHERGRRHCEEEKKKCTSCPASTCVGTCPTQYLQEVNAKFGPTTSSLTVCQPVAKVLKIAVDMSTEVIHPKTTVPGVSYGINQALNNVQNMINSYSSLYGLNLLSGDYQLIVIAHFQGPQFLLNNSGGYANWVAYNNANDPLHPKYPPVIPPYTASYSDPNPTPINDLTTSTTYYTNYYTQNGAEATVLNLISQGVVFYVCQNTMTAQNIKTADLIPGVKMVPSGVVSLVNFTFCGWAVINP